MAVFRSFSVVVSLLCTAIARSQTASPETCQGYIDSRNCDFYSQCVETRVTCGTDGYALRDGDRYCRRFADLSGNFNAQGQQWIQNVRQCLMQEIRRSQVYEVANTSTAACTELKDGAFNSHSKCYVEHGFCSSTFFSINGVTNLRVLFSAIDMSDFLRKETLLQVLKTILLCGELGLQSIGY